MSRDELLYVDDLIEAADKIVLLTNGWDVGLMDAIKCGTSHYFGVNARRIGSFAAGFPHACWAIVNKEITHSTGFRCPNYIGFVRCHGRLLSISRLRHIALRDSPVDTGGWGDLPLSLPYIAA